MIIIVLIDIIYNNVFDLRHCGLGRTEHAYFNISRWNINLNQKFPNYFFPFRA